MNNEFRGFLFLIVGIFLAVLGVSLLPVSIFPAGGILVLSLALGYSGSRLVVL